MASIRHRRWQAFWRVVDEPGTGPVAVHESGLRVTLQGAQGVAQNATEIAQAFVPQHGPHNAPAMVQRLLREGAQMLVDPQARGWRS